jgi:hypothetical protein
LILLWTVSTFRIRRDRFLFVDARELWEWGVDGKRVDGVSKHEDQAEGNDEDEDDHWDAAPCVMGGGC